MNSSKSNRKRNERDDNDADDLDMKQSKKYRHHDDHDHGHIFRNNNHIYFTSHVNTDNINRLIKLINDANLDFAELSRNYIVQSIVPKPIYLHVNSEGGDLFEGFRAMDAVANSKIPIYTVCEGTAVSAGALIYLAGKRRFMTEYSYLLIHQLSASCKGTYEMLKDDGVNNKHLMNRIAEFISKKSGGKLTKKKLDEILKHDIFWPYSKCIKIGMVDELYDVCINENMVVVEN